MGSAILTEIITLLTGGITSIATGIGTGLSTLVQSVFIVESTTSGGGTTYALSAFGVIVVVFAGISLAIGLCKLIVHMVSTLGGSKA